MLGMVSPVSQRDTACLVTNTLSASSSWESPCFILSSKILSLVFIQSSSSVVTILYHIFLVMTSNLLLRVMVKLEFIEEIGLCTFLSVAKEKYQKNRHVRKVPRYFPYGSYPLSGAAFLPFGKKG